MTLINAEKYADYLMFVRHAEYNVDSRVNITLLNVTVYHWHIVMVSVTTTSQHHTTPS